MRNWREGDSVTGLGQLSFAQLPMIMSNEELRRVHNTAGLLLVKRNGKAHSSMTCLHNEDTEFVNNPSWRIATDAECRRLGIP
jgi:hypothetical protein